MLQSLAFSRQHWPETAITISAQQYLQKFYTELGFESAVGALRRGWNAPYPNDD